ncbi:hypothetical protein Tco_0926102 [Tanacetum coccineum]|uniref:Integrase, catalytic region, zinc finger, CCHC-type, peptidase aspartic, catalytic n=1 Tax=Tanacetum coccineum TaxID=301880 RepID=A0ABQ5DBJ7_9ASTR
MSTDIPSSSSLVMTGCPDCTLILRNGHPNCKDYEYGDYQLGNVVISRVYYVEALGHNLFSVGQFCDADLEVAFRKNTCFIRNLEGVDLLSGSETQICTQFLLMTCLNHLRSIFYPKLQILRAGYGTVDYLILTSVL